METPDRPNVMLVLVDDMGFADLGFMGSEIQTPNLDQLARDGMAVSAMYNCARCCPTRASLLTGLYPHSAGVGHMGADLGAPEYQGFLRDDTATIAEAMKAGGYRTLMSGKWHVGGDLWATRVSTWDVGGPKNPTPTQRGFDRFFGMLDGVTHFFSPHCITRGMDRIDVSPTEFFLTDAIADEAIEMIEESVAMEQPFFMYLAHHAPHWPLNAREETIAKYKGVYDAGWDAVREARHKELVARQILPPSWEMSPRDESAQPWEDAPHKEWEARRMAVYAAMIDELDQSIGRVIDTLKRLGQFDNTLILFLSDNGGCAELMTEDGWAKFYPDVHNDGTPIQMGNRPEVEPGGPYTFMSYDLPWANVSNTPFRLFKHWVHEGGISTPLIAHWPNRIPAGGLSDKPCHVVDLLPTILDATGVKMPTEVNGRKVQSPVGESFLPLVQGAEWSREQPIFWEHEGNSAIRLGKYKLVRKFDEPWELYDMENDRTELHNLASKDPSTAQRLEQEYQAWAQRTGVQDWNVLLPKLLEMWEMTDTSG